jgi:DNA polymerase-3 subunit delta'
MFFKDIIGQDELIRQLIQSTQRGFVPHARLFSGQAGSGAFPLALAYARYLNCSERTETDSCGHCPSCLKYNDLVHPDLHFVFPIVQVKERKKEICDDYLDEWRDFLKTHTYFDLGTWLSHLNVDSKQAWIYAKESEAIFRKVSLRIYEAYYRVLFVWIPERMHSNCSNKLLKIIEEPPQNTLIFMISEEPEYILGTILSRMQRLNVGPVSTDVLARVAEQEFGIDPSQSQQIAHMAHGNYLQLADAIRVSEESDFFLAQFTRIMRNSWTRNVKEMKAFAEDMAALGRDQQKRFLAYCQRLIRENFVYRFQVSEMNYMTQDESTFSARFAEYVNERNVFDFVDELAEAYRHVAQNGNSKMVFFDLALHITVLLKK